MWKLKDKPTTSKVTKALAKEFAEMDPAPHDRPLSERRLQIYARMLNQGLFRPVTWARAFCEETGGVYRVNGKHTSVLLSALKVMPDFFVTVEDYDCDSLEDVAKLYATFDSTTQTRTARDIYASFAATMPELREVAHRTIAVCIGALSFEKWGDRYSSHSTSPERAELLLDEPEFVLWLHELISSECNGENRRSSDHIMRVPVVAAMLATWRKAKAASREFWMMVRDETGISPNMPDRKLARYLLTVGVASGGGVANRIKLAPPREIYVKAIHAWNAWRKGETTNLNYHADSDIPAIR